MTSDLPALVVLALVIVCTAQGISAGTTYYVDVVNGADGNPGTSPTLAWRTIAKVNAASLKPGDVILLHRGQKWREQLVVSCSGDEAQPITYASYGRSGGKPIIDGADIYAGDQWDHEAGSVWSKPNHLQFDAAFAAQDKAKNKFIVTIDGTRYLPVPVVGALRQHTYTYDNITDRLLVFLADDPDDHVTESATRRQSIIIDGQRHIVLRDIEVMNSVADNIYGTGPCAHVRLEGVISHHAGTRGLLIGGDNLATNPDGWAEHITIERCIFYNNGIRGDSAATDIGLSRSIRRVTIRCSVVYGDGQHWGVDGIVTGGGSNGAGHLIEGNLIFGHEENEIDLKGHFESPAEEGRTVIRNNILFDSDNAVVTIHYGSRDVDILYNFICDGGTYGISIYNHDGHSMYDGQEGNVVMAYNIITDNSLAGIRDGGRGSAIPAGGNKLHNNVILGNGKGSDLGGVHVQSSGWDIRNNIIWNNCDRSRDLQLRLVTPESSMGLVLNHNLIGVDPMFVDPVGGDYHLTPLSPAIDAAAELGYRTDLDGDLVPQGKAPDIGADEYTPGTFEPQGRQLCFFWGASDANGAAEVEGPVE
jgi:hypothetical protein